MSHLREVNHLLFGFDYELQNKENNEELFGFSLGQIFRDKNDNRLPRKSKMQNKTSDVIGNLSFFPNEYFKLNYDFSADNNFDTMNYNKLETKLSVNNFVTSFEFLEENNEIGSESYLNTDIEYLFNKFNF